VIEGNIAVFYVKELVEFIFLGFVVAHNFEEFSSFLMKASSCELSSSC
jgi:hypothetical protein